jgi:5-hydroxyisourate hydrolase
MTIKPSATKPAGAGRLTTHVLDTSEGKPAARMGLTLSRIEGAEHRLIGRFQTNDDGRCDAPLLAGDALRPGVYEILFQVAAWRAARGEPGVGFYDDIPIRFRVADPHGHYHVPLIVSPFGYSTYRGS